MAIQATGRATFTAVEDYDIVFVLNGVRCDVLNFDSVRAAESAVLEADFFNGGAACVVDRAVIGCYDRDGALMGSTIEARNSSSAVAVVGSLYLSKDCKTVSCEIYTGEKKVCSRSIAVVRNGSSVGVKAVSYKVLNNVAAGGALNWNSVQSQANYPTQKPDKGKYMYVMTIVLYTDGTTTNTVSTSYTPTDGTDAVMGRLRVNHSVCHFSRTSNSWDYSSVTVSIVIMDGDKIEIPAYGDTTKYFWRLSTDDTSTKRSSGMGFSASLSASSITANLYKTGSDENVAIDTITVPMVFDGQDGEGQPATVYTIEPFGSIEASGTLKDASHITVTIHGDLRAFKTTGDSKAEYSTQPQCWKMSVGDTDYCSQNNNSPFSNNAGNSLISFSLNQDYGIGSVPGSANITLYKDNTLEEQLASLIVPISLNAGAIVDVNSKLGTIQSTTASLQGEVTSIRQGQGEINLKVQDLMIGGVDTGKPHTSSQVDFRALDNNSFYPVLIRFNDGGGIRRTVEISRSLDSSYGKPPYSTHGGGFSMRLIFSDVANRWGTYEDGQLRIESITQSWTTAADTPICPKIAQYNPFSIMVAWLRGGSKYDVSVDCADAYISGIWPYMMQVASDPSWVPEVVSLSSNTWTTEQVNAQGGNPYNLLKHDSGGFYADTKNEFLYRFGSMTAGNTFAIVGQPKDSKMWFMATWHIASVSGSKIYVDTSTYGILWQTQNPLGIRMDGMSGYIKRGVSYSKSTWDSEQGFGTSESIDNTEVYANWVTPRPILIIGKESSATNGVYRDRAVLESVESCSKGSSVSFYNGTFFDVSPLYGTDGRKNVKPDLLATGIDIKSHKIVATGDNFVVRNNSGGQTFSIDRDGNIVGSGNASFKGTVYASGGSFTGTVTAAQIYGTYINGGTITGTTITGSAITSTSAGGKSVTKIVGGQLTTGTTNKLIIDTPSNEPGGVLRITQDSDDVVKLGVTDITGKAYADVKGAWKSETIARNVCVGPYLMLGQWIGQGRGENGNTFSFLSKNFMYVKHVDAEFLNVGGMRMTPITLTDIDFANHKRLKDIDEVYMSFHGYSQYNHPSELYFWNSSEITFDLGDPADHDDRGLVKNTGRILYIWQMGARIIFKATPNSTSGNTAACMYLGRKIRGDTSFDSNTLGQLNIIMSDGKHWIMHYMND